MKTRKILSMILALAMVASFIPASLAAVNPPKTPSDIEGLTDDQIAEYTMEALLDMHNLIEQEDESVKPTVAQAVSFSANNLLDDDGIVASGLSFSKDDYLIDFLNEKIIINPAEAKNYINTDTDGVKSINANSLIAKYPVKFVSFDGGNKWAPISIGVGGVDISKQLDKSCTILLTNNLDTNAKPNAPKVGDKGKGTPDSDGYIAPVAGSVTYTFGATADRPKAEKFKANFLTYGHYDQWAAADGVDTMKLDISVADASGKNPTFGWFKFPNGTTETKSLKEGIYIQEITGGKPGKTTYLVRTSPDAKTLTPASKPFKLSVPTFQKAPSFKVDYKNGTIKAKEFTQWGYLKTITQAYNSIGEYVCQRPADASELSSYVAYELGADGAIVLKSDYTEVTSHYPSFVNNDKDKPLNYAVVSGTNRLLSMSKDAAKTGLLLTTITKDGNLYGKDLALRIGPSEKKPASAVQIISVAPMSYLFQVDFKAAFAKGKMNVDKKLYEFYDEGKQKWGSAPKAAGTYKVRIKNTAKYDAKTNKTNGNVNSDAMEITLVSGSFDPKKPDKQGLVDYTVKSFPMYDGLVWVDKIMDEETPPKAVTALDIDSKPIAGATASSKYNIYTGTDGISIVYDLVTPGVVNGKVETTPFDEAPETNVKLNPTDATLADLTDGKYYITVNTEKAIIKSATFVPATGKLTIAVKSDTSDTTTLEDLADSIGVSLHYAAKDETAVAAMTDAEKAAEAKKVLMASKFYSPAVPVTVTEPVLKFNLPAIEGAEYKVNYAGSEVDVPEEGIKYTDITNDVVLTLEPTGQNKLMTKSTKPDSTLGQYSVPATGDLTATLGTTTLYGNTGELGLKVTISKGSVPKIDTTVTFALAAEKVLVAGNSSIKATALTGTTVTVTETAYSAAFAVSGGIVFTFTTAVGKQFGKSTSVGTDAQPTDFTVKLNGVTLTTSDCTVTITQPGTASAAAAFTVTFQAAQFKKFFKPEADNTLTISGVTVKNFDS